MFLQDLNDRKTVILITDDKNPVDSTEEGNYLIKNNKYRITGLDETSGGLLALSMFSKQHQL